MKTMPRIAAHITAAVLMIGLLANLAGAVEPEVSLQVLDKPLGAPAKFGLEQLTAALKPYGQHLNAERPSIGRAIVVGTFKSSAAIRKMVESGELKLEQKPEALAVHRIIQNSGDKLVIAGYDDVGLMYALLDQADAVNNAGDSYDWFASVKDISETPANSMRRVRVLMHHAANEKGWYHSKEFWDWYIGMLATNRFNGLNLVYSHQSPYMAPMYAWHLQLDEFPSVRAKGVSDEERQQNLEVLRHVAKICHDRGIELTIGVWQHLPWKHSYVQTREDQESLVEGLDEKNVRQYTAAAIKKLLQECPGIARIQIRPNDESGIHLSDQTAFYRDYVMRPIKESAPHVKLDLRTVGVQQATIQAARDADLDVRTSIKFFGEFMGQPYTPQQTMTRGYSYNQHLKKPRPNPVYNEVWVLGSHRVLLWGSEDYGRRFGRNASYGGTIGFETDTPLAQKGYQKPMTPEWRIFNSKDDEYYTHEIERYWAFFRTIGRFGYNPDAPREVWLRPFRKRFGDAAETMAKAYESASQVIGLIVASHVENPNMYTWPEIGMGGLISAYTELQGMDAGMFPSIDHQVEDELAGRLSGQMGARNLTAKYGDIARQIDREIGIIERQTSSPSKELRATISDFKLLSRLAKYHAHRQLEGYSMAKFYRTGDASLLTLAAEQSKASADDWKEIVKIADPLYYPHIQTGPIENGHWKDKTFLVETNAKIIREAADTLHTHGLFDYGLDFGAPAKTGEIKVFYFHKYGNDYARDRRFAGVHPGGLYNPADGYGFLSPKDLQATDHPMRSTRNLSGAAPMPNSPLPLDLICGDFVHSKNPIRFRMDLPQDGYRLTYVFADHSAKPMDNGPFDLRSGAKDNGRAVHKNIRVPAGETIYRQSDQHIRRFGWDPFWIFSLVPSEKDADAMISGLTVHRQAPKLAHAPWREVQTRDDCTLSVTITMPPRPVGDNKKLSAAPGDRLARAELHYRTNPDSAFTTMPLKSEDGFVFSATIPHEMLGPGWLEYYFTADDASGHSEQLPKAEESRYFRARLSFDDFPPTITHEPIVKCQAGKPLVLKARAEDADGVTAVRAYYRQLDESVPYQCIALRRDGEEYIGTIPGEAISADYDLVYYLEAVDEAGNGTIFPDWQTSTPYVIVTTQSIR
jgi:hypothetical protein